MRNLLVMGQLALSLVTLTAAGMFIRSAVTSAASDPGFTFDRGIMVNVDPSLAGRNPAASRQFYERAIARLRAMPNVASASMSSLMPFGEFTSMKSVQKAGAPLKREAAGSSSMGYGDSSGETIKGLVDSVATSIGADYFATMGLAVKQGREFTQAEELADGGTRIAIIDETLAHRLFDTGNPIDQLVQWQSGTSEQPGNAPWPAWSAWSRPAIINCSKTSMPPHLYTPIGQDYRSMLYLHVRTTLPIG